MDRRDGSMTLNKGGRIAYVTRDGKVRLSCDPASDWSPTLIAASIRKAKAMKAAA